MIDRRRCRRDPRDLAVRIKNDPKALASRRNQIERGQT